MASLVHVHVCIHVYCILSPDLGYGNPLPTARGERLVGSDDDDDMEISDDGPGLVGVAPMRGRGHRLGDGTGDDMDQDNEPHPPIRRPFFQPGLVYSTCIFVTIIVVE